MSDEPSLKDLLRRAWHIRLEATNLKIQIVWAVAESLSRNLRLILAIARQRWRHGDR